MRALAGERYGHCGLNSKFRKITGYRRANYLQPLCRVKSQRLRTPAYLVAMRHSAYMWCTLFRGRLVFATCLSGSMSAERRSMNIFIFKSEANRDLRAFSDDQGGHKLPAQFRPWHAIGVVKPESKPPNNLSRDVIEKSIADAGYQLYKLKSDK
jgi:hypothetical protein